MWTRGRSARSAANRTISCARSPTWPRRSARSTWKTSRRLLGEDDIAAMAQKPIVFALANPDPEVDPEVARRRAVVVATGRSDFPNQINNVLAFPGVFRGLLDGGSWWVTARVQLAAADALSHLLDEELRPDMIVPSIFDERVVPRVAKAVDAASR